MSNVTRTTQVKLQICVNSLYTYLGNVKFITFGAKYTSFRMHYIICIIHIFTYLSWESERLWKYCANCRPPNIIFWTVERDVKSILRIRHLYHLIYFVQPDDGGAILELFSWGGGGKKPDARIWRLVRRSYSRYSSRLQLYTSETAVSLADLSIPDKLSVACAAASPFVSSATNSRAFPESPPKSSRSASIEDRLAHKSSKSHRARRYDAGSFLKMPFAIIASIYRAPRLVSVLNSGST